MPPSAHGSMVCATIAHHADWHGFRQQARALLLAGVPPWQVHWQMADAPQPDLFEQPDADGIAADRAVIGTKNIAAFSSQSSAMKEQAIPARAVVASVSGASAATPAPPLQAPATPRVPARFLRACQHIMLHHSPERLPLLYRLLWRLQHESTLRQDALDPDVQQARQLERTVQREIHHLQAFARFRPVLVAQSSGVLAQWQPAETGTYPADKAGAANMLKEQTATLWQVAWFEPQHHVVQAAASFFVRRFPNHCWAILTPLGCVYWDTQSLRAGPPAQADQAPPPDADEQLWLTYYAHTFNPARLKLNTMRSFMPRHYWRNLPEAQLIQPLAATASARTAGMWQRAAAPATPVAEIDNPSRQPL